MFLKGASGPSVGPNLFPEDLEGYVKISGKAGLRGEVWELDIAGSVATTAPPGTETSIWGVAVQISADAILDANVSPHFMVLLLEAGADGDIVRCLVHGRAKGLVIDAVGSPAIGEPLVMNGSEQLDAVCAATERQVGFMEQALTTPTVAVLADVYFNGLWSLGRGLHA